MKKTAVIAATIFLFASAARPVRAQEDGLWGGGIYHISLWTLPTVRLGFQEKVFIDFGLNFSTNSQSNYAVMFKGAGRFYELSDDIFVHGGAVIGIVEVQNTNVFQLGFLLGAEGFLNDSFSVTADVAPLQITANGDTEAYFLQGFFGVNLYLR